ncbi:glycoside hydrolase family 25 protein [Amycolatopsis sp. NPDC059657]|uniref:glycoside hydrolase family 25 protein n=1 Tax=Amycolatopsis sp. NPDC059657 TaxID=3346899 RepID=UPI003670AD28
MTDPVTFIIDISHHQPLSLDLAQCRRDGCEACFIKAGEGGSYVDPLFAANLAEARAAGMLTAAYWFIRSNASPAAHVAKIRATVPLDVPIIPDVEKAVDGSWPTKAHTDAVIAAIIAAGYRVPIDYIPLWFWRDYWRSPSLAGGRPLWSSRYPDNVVGLLNSEWAQVPASYWNGYGGQPVAILQFTSSARIAGYAPLDASAYRGTREELAALLNQEEEMPLSIEDFKTVWYKATSTLDGVEMSAATLLEKTYLQTNAIADALAKLLEHATDDPAITADFVKQTINDAVKQNISITGEVHIGPAAGGES